MKRLSAILLVLLSYDGLAQSTAFVNVNVVSMVEEGVLAGQTVVVSEGRITATGDAADTVLPDDARIVDGTDRFLLPGLAEMHGHITDTTPAALDRLFALYLANGVTTVRGMLGRPAHLQLRDALSSGDRFGPRIITSGPSLNGTSVDSPVHAERLVRQQHAAGYDFLKIHPGLTRAEFASIAATANALNIPFAGHVPADVGVEAALEAGITTIDHLDGYMETLLPADRDSTGGVGGFFGVLLAELADESRIDEIVAKTQAAGTWIVPTQSLFEHSVDGTDPQVMTDWPEMKYVPTSDKADWVKAKLEISADPAFDRAIGDRAIELRRTLILALHNAGVGLLLGSDSPQRFNVPGFSLHRELEFLVASGLTPYEALRTGTVNAARFLGVSGERGTVAVGQAADLVLLDDNPLEDIRYVKRVHGTMIRGRWYARADLRRLLKLAEVR